MSPTKAELRQRLQKTRLALPLQKRQAKSRDIVGRLWQVIDWSLVKTLHCFEPIKRLGEVDISDFVKVLQIKYPNIQIFTSRQIDGSWKTVSLDNTQNSTPLHFDVIIVPMLGFDANLHRIGYGGGFYDRFLATQPQAKKIGVCFNVGRLKHPIPVEPHDMPLDTIIS